MKWISSGNLKTKYEWKNENIDKNIIIIYRLSFQIKTVVHKTVKCLSELCIVSHSDVQWKSIGPWSWLKKYRLGLSVEMYTKV